VRERFDPYRVLGVRPSATVGEIRRAYRRRALRYHPDMRPLDPTRAAQEFHRLVRAYRQILSRRGRSVQTDSPSGEAPNLAATEEGIIAYQPRSAGENGYFHSLPGARKVTFATLNEPAVFLVLWGLALVLAAGVAYWIGTTPAASGSGSSATSSLLVVLAVLPLLLYVGVLTGGLGVLLLRRKALWFLKWFASRGLPRPGKDSPRS